MKGDIGMSLHEKEREQEDAYTKTQSFITPSLHLCFSNTLHANAFGCAFYITMHKDVGMRL